MLRHPYRYEYERNAPRRSRGDMVTRYLGICGVCEGEFKLTSSDDDPSPMSDSFKLAHHGYKRPGHGYIVGDCLGVHEAPYQVSLVATRKYERLIAQQELQTRNFLDRLESGDVEELFKKEWNGREYAMRRITPADGVVFRVELRDKVSAIKYELQGIEREMERIQRLIDNWRRGPVRTVDESLAEKRAGVDARKAERDAARAVRDQKRAAIDSKNQSREEERQALISEYRQIFNQLAFEPTDANKKLAASHWAKMISRRNKKAYLRFQEPDLGINEALEVLGLARPRANPHGKWTHNYANQYGWLS